MYNENYLIAKKNDFLRKFIPSVPSPHSFRVSLSVFSLPKEEYEQLLSKIVDFDDFNEDNDPNGKHESGSLTHNGKSYFWKIDNHCKNLKPIGKEGVKVISLMQSYERRG